MADGDEAAVVALWQACGLTRPWNDPAQDIAFARGKAGSDVLVGLLDGGIVASVMVGHDGHRGALYYVSVDPACRGRGYGRQIIAAAEGWMRERGVWKANLLVRAGNEAVLAFYEELGYARGSSVQIEKWLDPSKRGDA
jgi:ribosomal protein S18 acetylase RimI-like enzyme